MARSSRKALIAALALLSSLPVVAATIEELFEQPEIQNIKISPTGEYLAIRTFQGEMHGLLFLARESREPVGGLNPSGSDEVGEFFWANSERIVSQIYEVGKTQEEPINYGELFAINYDGKRPEFIFGYRSGERKTGSIIKKKTADFAWADIIDPFPADDREILISSTSMSDAHDRRSAAVMLDIYSGMEKRRVHASKYADATFVTDSEGEVRLVVSRTGDNKVHVEGLPAGSQEWIEFPDKNYGDYFTPVGIAEDRQSAFVLDNINSDKVGLFRLSLDGEEYEKIYAHDDVDVTEANVSADGRSVYAIRIDKGLPSYLPLASSTDEAQIFKSLLKTFPGRAIDITSRSSDGTFWIIHTSSDVDPGSFYIFDKKLISLAFLSKSLPKIVSEDLSPVEPIEFESFDGRKVTGYFTRAKNAGDRVAPLVVLVHGGPRARDYWQYNPEVQALATQGFSVLQINYRGSIGFGESFLRAGNLHWGDHIQQDIIAGTRWAIANGKGKDGKVCIMGTSFGAYSAVQSSILAPDLYTCAVANAGIYDLELLYERGDIKALYWGDAYLEEVVGRDKEQLTAFSPAYNVSALKAPLFIAHGKRDDRAPYEHALRLKKELDKHDKEYEWFIKSREAHGFYDTENQVEYMKAALDFLRKHLN